MEKVLHRAGGGGGFGNNPVKAGQGVISSGKEECKSLPLHKALTQEGGEQYPTTALRWAKKELAS